MKMKNRISIKVLMFATSLAMVLGGCASAPKIKPTPWTLSITKKTPASIEMDIIGVTESDQKYYEGMSWDDYWKADSQIRRDAPRLTRFLQKDKSWSVALKKDPKHPEYEDDSAKWADWSRRGVVELLLVARLPETGGLWKVPLPLDKNAWPKNQAIEVEVLDSRIVVLTPPARN